MDGCKDIDGYKKVFCMFVCADVLFFCQWTKNDSVDKSRFRFIDESKVIG